MSKLHAKIRSGSTIAMVANLVYLITRLAITPFILGYVSLAAYGLWAFCFVVLSYAGMSAFGIQNSYIKYTAEYFTAGQLDKINGLYSTGLCIMGAYAALFFLILVMAAPWIISLFDIEPSLVDLAQSLLLGTAAVFLLDLSLGAFRAILEGLQEIALSKAIWLSTTILEVLLIVVFLRMGTGLMGVMYAYIIKTLVDIFAHMVIAFRLLPSLRLHWSLIHRRYYHELFIFGGKVQVLGLLGMFMGSLDRIIITAMLGLDATGLFEIGRKLPFTARSITGAASAPFLPAASAMGGAWHGHRQLNLKGKLWHYGSLCIASLAFGLLILCPHIYSMERADFALLLQSSNMQDIFHFLNTMPASLSLPLSSPIFPIASSEWSLKAIALSLSLTLGLAVCLMLIILSIRKQWHVIRHKEYVENHDLSTLYTSASRYLNLINAVLYGFIMATGAQLIFAWLGTDYHAASIAFAVALMCLVHLATLPCSAIMRGINRSGRELEAVLINLILMLLWAPCWTTSYGLHGTVWAFTLSTIISSLYFIARTNTALQISFHDYTHCAIIPMIYPAFAAMIVYVSIYFIDTYFKDISRWHTLFMLIPLGLFYLILSFILLWSFAFTPREHQSIKDMVRAKKRLF